MAGGTRIHSAISANVSSILGQLLPEGYRPFGSDLKIYISATNKGLYPDVSVACRPIEAKDEINAITNPVLLVEVLSKGTSNYDRGEKFWFYSQLPSLREYILIEQEQWAVETRYRSSASANWEMTYFEGEAAEVVIRSFDVRVPMKRIYYDIADL